MTDGPVTAADLARLPLFEGLPEAELTELAARATRRRLADGETLLEQGAPARELYALIRGRLVLRTADERSSAIVATLGPGDILGWSALREEATALSSAEAAADTEVVAIPVDLVVQLAAGGSEAAPRLVRRLIGVAAADLEASRAQLLRSGREGVITGG